VTVRNASGTRMSKTTLKAALTEVTQRKVYTADQDYYINEQGEGVTAVEGSKFLLVRQGATISETEIDAAFPTASVSAITPATGPAAGGTVVRISGSNLAGAAGVTFGGTAGTAFSLLNDGRLQVTTPAKTAGAYNVVVTDDNGDLTVTNGYTYT
jgi:hypothetical protein